MHSLTSLLLTLAVAVTAFSAVDAFCGGCGCNIFGCNCDWGCSEHCRCRRKREDASAKAEFQFAEMDLDANGVLSTDEISAQFHNVSTMMESPVMQAFLQQQLAKLDKNGNGQIEKAEFDNDFK